jgi:spermidine synthase
MGRGVRVIVGIIQELVLSDPVRTLTEEEVEQLQLQYYNTDVHRAAFTVPQFVKKVCRTPDSQ